MGNFLSRAQGDTLPARLGNDLGGRAENERVHIII
jgi:hypothetical protein